MKNSFRLLHVFIFIQLLISCKSSGFKNQSESASLSDDNVKASSLILYVGTYTESAIQKGKKSAGIYIYNMDCNTGKLSYVNVSPFIVNPSYLAIHPDSMWLYAVNETGSADNKSGGAVSAFRISEQGKALEFINSVSSHGSYPCYVSIDQSGNYVMTANYGSGTVALFPLQPNGALIEATSIDQHMGKEAAAGHEGAHAHMIIPSPYGNFVYAVDLGTDKIYLYKIDPVESKLISTGLDTETKSGAGPRHLVFHPFKNLAYVVNELNGSIEAMQADTVTGVLTRFQIISTLSEGNGNEAACADIHISPSGKYLYASNRGIINNIAMYEINSETGHLTLIGHQPVKGRTPRNFIIDPTGTYLLVANQGSDNIVTFRIDQATGRLIDTGLEVTVPAPVCLKFLY
jgi:6-phosphogluconolactonase